MANKKIEPQTELERSILSKREIQEGLEYGKLRRGHPEGKVRFHVLEILEMINGLYGLVPKKVIGELRLIALIHDSLKHKVDRSKPKVGENNHGMLARRFAEQFPEFDKTFLSIIELHDTPYYTWRKFKKNGIFPEDDFKQKVYSVKQKLELFLMFALLDASTGDKQPEQKELFCEKLVELGYISKERVSEIVEKINRCKL